MPPDNFKHQSDETLRIVERVTEVWRARDLQGMKRLLAEDIIWSMNIDGSLAAVAESVHGSAAVLQKMQAFHTFFDFHDYEVLSCKAEARVADMRIFVRYSHRRTREMLETRFRQTIELDSDGLVAMVAEYHDRKYVEAFLRVVASEA